MVAQNMPPSFCNLAANPTEEVQAARAGDRQIASYSECNTTPPPPAPASTPCGRLNSQASLRPHAAAPKSVASPLPPSESGCTNVDESGYGGHFVWWKFKSKSRVRHPTRGCGTVEIIKNGNKPYKVTFDNGEVHRYSKESAAKLQLCQNEEPWLPSAEREKPWNSTIATTTLIDRNYASDVLSQLIGHYKQRRHTDAAVLVGDKRFDVHVCIMCCGSAYFRGLFESMMAEGVTRTVELQDVQPHIFEMILESLYSGVLSPIDADNAVQLLEASKRLQVAHAEKQCCEWLVAHLSAYMHAHSRTHGTARHGTAQQGTAQHGTAQHGTLARTHARMRARVRRFTHVHTQVHACT